ncbi:hypothetical protein EDEG_01938 [Edhazardia aedis USNM 41457]|uniref:Uncharacterized protein n=1 Tax=Edhazardia aedis (strain USNM 41457) TaxID=1003232 RepID=J8ZVQ3_EDHAE|nr:hypothetical protein EDEG_01938 [Edhazardia aedis USNM 41457]|eukprot:EJW03743.1 hypothetical protein EDEG_01938 [Edhazardia aedis USNM 41457]
MKLITYVIVSISAVLANSASKKKSTLGSEGNKLVTNISTSEKPTLHSISSNPEEDTLKSLKPKSKPSSNPAKVAQSDSVSAASGVVVDKPASTTFSVLSVTTTPASTTSEEKRSASGKDKAASKQGSKKKAQSTATAKPEEDKKEEKKDSEEVDELAESKEQANEDNEQEQTEQGSLMPDQGPFPDLTTGTLSGQLFQMKMQQTKPKESKFAVFGSAQKLVSELSELVSKMQALIDEETQAKTALKSKDDEGSKGSDAIESSKNSDSSAPHELLDFRIIEVANDNKPAHETATAA